MGELLVLNEPVNVVLPQEYHQICLTPRCDVMAQSDYERSMSYELT
jgi:hypothetical protein